jgi:hypothetical protein
MSTKATAHPEHASDNTQRPHLSADRWMPAAESPEFTCIRTRSVADLYRASRGIKSIARLLHNSIGDGMDELVRPVIDTFDMQSLAGAVECIADFIYETLEDEAFREHQIEEMRREAGHE